MSKRKEWYKDYATHAFIRYAGLGKPTRLKLLEKIEKEVIRSNKSLDADEVKSKVELYLSSINPLLLDIDAVNATLDKLANNGKDYICKALNDVYFVDPKGKPRKGTITARVRWCAMNYPASEKTIYTWLKEARLIFCKERGLNVGQKNEKW